MNDKAGIKKFRSPPYPFLTMARAIERASQLFQKAQHYPVGLNVLANAWGFSPQSSGLVKSAAALIQYGLIKDQGSGDARKFQLTDAAGRILQDADPNSERRKTLLRATALAPTIHKELWEKFGDPSQLSDAVLKNHLLFDRKEVGEAPFSSTSADDVISTYRDALAFSGLDRPETSIDDSLNGGDSDISPQPSERNRAITAALGDLIQWESSGVLQFKHPRKVRWISDDGAWLAVEGSETGIPASEVIIAQRTMALPEIPREEESFNTTTLKPSSAVNLNQMRRDVFALEEGEITLTMPASICQASFDDFSDWLDLMKRKVQRTIKADAYK